MSPIASNSEDPLPAMAEQLLRSHEQAPARSKQGPGACIEVRS